MRQKSSALALFAAALMFVALFASACGEEEEASNHAREGEPLELGELAYNIQITRFLNPYSIEDSAYLEGVRPLKPREQYLGVFMQVTNHGTETASIPYPFKIADTRGTEYRQLRLDEDNVWALTPGAPIPPDQTFPNAESPARNGPIQGSLAVFAVLPSANSNRPLELIVPGDEQDGRIELDI